jgi:hypothetical protein
MITRVSALPDNTSFDLVVIGAGAGGMAAAAFGAIAGKRVLLVERTEYLGGTSALSAATVWAPGNSHATEVAPVGSTDADSFDKARTFLDSVVGNHAPASLRRAFLRSAPQAIATLEAASQLRFRPYPTHPDYEQDHEGATMRGRALEPVPFDARALGDDINLIRPPIPEFCLFDGMMIDRRDINHLLAITKNLASFRHSVGILAHYGLDRLKRRRGTRLVMGNALIGRLLLTLRERKVSIVTRTEVVDFITGARGVEGVVLRGDGVQRRILASRGVVLAAGGFTRHPTRRADMLPGPTPEFSPAAPGHTGAMQDLALKLGARFGEGNLQPAFWAPVSIRKRKDGSTAVFPHFVMDRSKPGTVCVNQAGERFVNESTSYHLFGKAMFEANQVSPCIPCWIITDAPGLKKYGLGMVRMGTSNLKPFLEDGYLITGTTVAELAQRIGVPAPALERTIANMNAYAKTGIDPEFQRGRTAYHRVNGDATAGQPNPTLGPIATAPFYAVKLLPGDIGASSGLVIDENAQVMGETAPIDGLYACGNEANSIMGGTYPGPGITLGPALTFAYRAVQHALTGEAG